MDNRIVDILNKFGINESKLINGDCGLELDIKSLLSRLYSAKRADTADAVLEYIFSKNAYLAAKCCFFEKSAHKMHAESLLNEWLSISIESQVSIAKHPTSIVSQRPWLVLMALYQLRRYETAQIHLKESLRGSSDKIRNYFFEKLVAQDLPRIEDQTYLLCHCFNSSYFFAPLIRLARINKWRCTLDPNEGYIDDLRLMIVSLVKLKEYRVLTILSKILGKTSREGREFIVKNSGYSQKMEFISHLHQQYRLYNGRPDALLEQLIFELAVLDYPDKHSKLARILCKLAEYNDNMRQYFGLQIFMISVYEFCECKTDHVLNGGIDSRIFPCNRINIDFSYSNLYWRYLKRVTDSILNDPFKGIRYLKAIKRYPGCWLLSKDSDALNNEANGNWAGSFSIFLNEKLMSETYKTFAREKIREWNNVKLSTDQIMFIYQNTYLRILFCEEEFKILIPVRELTRDVSTSPELMLTSLSDEAGTAIRVAGILCGECCLVPYEGKLKEYTKKKGKPLFLVTKGAKHSKPFPVTYIEEEERMYMQYNSYFAFERGLIGSDIVVEVKDNLYL